MRKGVPGALRKSPHKKTHFPRNAFLQELETRLIIKKRVSLASMARGGSASVKKNVDGFAKIGQ
jgi:hypothetical protein